MKIFYFLAIIASVTGFISYLMCRASSMYPNDDVIYSELLKKRKQEISKK